MTRPAGGSRNRADAPISQNVGPEKNAWLFTRGDQSVYVARLPMGMALVVRGPGFAEHSHHFDSEESLNDFWRWYKRHLLGEEWVLTIDRRTGKDRPSGVDRRRTPPADGESP